jgi:hypothetical protein
MHELEDSLLEVDELLDMLKEDTDANQIRGVRISA